MGKKASGIFTIKNQLGMHARPSSLFVQTASGFDSEVRVEKEETGESANGKSLMTMLMLSAGFGTKLKVTAEGADAENALKALAELINRGFDEE